MNREFGIYPENCVPRQWWGARAIIDKHVQLDFLPDRQSVECVDAVTIEEQEAFHTWILHVAIPAMQNKVATGFFRKWEDILRLTSQDGEGHAAGHISNKTLYIAMNYQSEAARLSGENMDEIMRQLIPLEREVHRLEHHLSLLPSRAQTVLRMYYMEKMPWEAIAEALSSTPRTAQKLRVAAVAQLAELYSCVKPAD